MSGEKSAEGGVGGGNEPGVGDNPFKRRDRRPHVHRRPEPKMRKEPYIVRTDQTAEAYAAKRVARAEGVGQCPTEYARVRRAGHG